MSEFVYGELSGVSPAPECSEQMPEGKIPKSDLCGTALPGRLRLRRRIRHLAGGGLSISPAMRNFGPEPIRPRYENHAR